MIAVTQYRFPLLLLLASLCSTLSAAQQSKNHHSHPQAGTDIGAASAPLTGEVLVDFSLENAGGERVQDEDFRGKYLLLAFGFTDCAHICPVIAANMSRVIDTAKQPVSGVFISVDTERDNARRTDAYAKQFNQKMIGLGGNYREIAQVAGNFQANFSVSKSPRNYTVQHTSSIYLIDPQGQFIEAYPMNEPVSSYIKAMK